MAETPTVRVVSFAPASRKDQLTGQLGWLILDVAGLLRLEGVSLRRTATGRVALSFPQRRDARERIHDIVRPLDDTARRVIERQVLASLQAGEDSHS